jgi:hypothetical protein
MTDIDASNSALKEMLLQNPLIKPADSRDLSQKFTDLIVEYLNPGIYSVFDEKTGEGITHISYTTNACILFENINAALTYNCSFAAGYAKSVQVDAFNKINLDMGALLANGMQVEYKYKVNSDESKEIFNSLYYTF